jgi:CRISPR/Cas system-associated endonuclease/helicase Cas3
VITDNDVSTRAQSLLMPELARISTLISSNRELSFNEILLFVDDLKTYCDRDFDVAYSWRAYNRAMKYEDMNIVLRTEERKRERERAREIYLSTHPWEAIPMWDVT